VEVARNVLLTFARPGQDRRFRGTGFHLRKNLVLTADHCADGRDYQVWRSDKQMPGQVVWRSGDASADLALLEVDGLPEVEPVALAVLDTAAGGVLEDCVCGCYPSFGRLDPLTQGGLSGPDRLVPLTGNLLLDSVHVARIPGGWDRDGRVALSLTSDRSLFPEVRGTVEEVTQAWSAASGGAVLVTVGGRRFCVGVISARQVKETPTALRVAGFDLLTGLDPESAAGFWDRVGVSGIAGLMTVGGTVRAEQVVVGQIPRRAPGYVDRDVTAELVERIAATGTVTLVSLAGLRGVGKSQTAGEVARHSIQHGWPVVAWVNTETRDSALSDLRLLADRLGAVVQGEPPETSVQRLYSMWATDRTTPRLVVFDNIADRHDLDGLWPPEASAAVIATTADRSITVGEVLDVGVFTHEQALAYLEDGTALADPEGATRVAHELGRLPLALAGAAWTITGRRRNDHDYGYSHYLEELAQQPLDRLLEDDKATLDYPRATLAALSLAVKTALDAAADNRELTRSVLGALAYLDPGGVPRRWFNELGQTFDVRDALGVIADSGLAQPSDDTTSVIMHRLVGRVIRSVSDRDGWASRAMAAAASLIGAVRPLDRDDYWARRAEAIALAAHVLALLGDPDHGVDEQVISAGVGAGYALNALSDPYAAITVLRPLSASAERVFGADHPGTLVSRNNLAFAYRSVGDLGRAIPLYEATSTDIERVLGMDHPDTLISRNNLAGAYMSAGDLVRAVLLYEATLADRERVLGVDHPNTLASRNNLAVAYRSAGDMVRAIPLFEATLADRERVLGVDHPDTLNSRNNLAHAYESAGDTVRAIPLYEATLADRERVLGVDHPDTLASRNNLAGAYRSAGDLERAIPLFEVTWADQERVLGADHPDALTSRGNLAGAYRSVGDLVRAIPLFEATLADCERVLGPDHPATLLSRSNLAVTLAEDGADEKALSLAHLNADESRRVFGAEDSRTLDERDTVALVLLVAGRAQEAIEPLTDLLADCRRILGDHAVTRTVEEHLAQAIGEATA
jgi:tetratricopeptide (TPR) repeat protein